MAFSFVVLLFSGCSRSSEAKIIAYDIASKITDLDPQFTTDDNAKTIIANTMDGLFEQKSDGSIQNAVAESISASDDGLTYSVKLKKNYKWSNGTPVTAYDFEFAIKRMFNKDAFSPNCADFAVIKNAKNALNGKADQSQLGITAVSDYELKIELDEPYPFITELFSTTASMPCNSSFFYETKGKYGLNLKNLIVNGAFKISKWKPDEYIYLRKNEEYPKAADVALGGVNIYIGRENVSALFKKQKTDALPVTYSESLLLDAKKFNVAAVENISWVVLFNLRDSSIANPNIRKGLAMSINKEVLGDYLPDNIRLYNSIMPACAKIGNISVSSFSSNSSNYSPQNNAFSVFNQGLQELKLSKLEKASIIMPENDDIGLSISFLQQMWQNSTGAYINIQPLSNSQFKQKLKTGDYKMAIVPITPVSSNPIAILQGFTTQGSEFYTGYSSQAFDNFIALAKTADTPQAAAELVYSAQQQLIADNIVLPLFIEKQYYATGKKITGIEFLPFGRKILFKNALSAK